MRRNITAKLEAERAGISIATLAKIEAEKILKNIIEVVPKWKDYASTIGISHSEQEEMQHAFRWK